MYIIFLVQFWHSFVVLVAEIFQALLCHCYPNNSTLSALTYKLYMKARPQTAGEEELQLQLALSMSKEEAENERKVNNVHHFISACVF